MCLPAAIALRTRSGRPPVAEQSMKIFSGPASASSRLVVQRLMPCAAASALMLLGVAPDQHQLGDQPVAVLELQPAFLGDGQQMRHVLRRAHAARWRR